MPRRSIAHARRLAPIGVLALLAALLESVRRLEAERRRLALIVRDVGERADHERRQSEFVATASHELRSPLTSIKGFVELLERSPEQMSERQREFVDIILRSTDRLVDLVNDLLDVARIDAHQLETSHGRSTSARPSTRSPS